jgi:type IV pilus assembly protein PilW
MTATSQNLVVNPGAFDRKFGQGIEGFEANGTTPPAAIAQPALPVVGATNNWTPNLDPAVTGANPGQPVQGSDVLVLRSSVPRITPTYTTVDVAPGAAALTVTPTLFAVAGNAYAAVSDCTKSVIFQVPVAVALGATAVTLNAGVPIGFSAGALVTPLTTTIYYIGVGSDGDSSLFRLEQVNGGPGFINPPEELVPDIENMQVLYGIDPTGTQTAAAYVPANQAGVTNVVSIQVALLVASPAAGKQVPAAAPYNLLGTQVTVPADNRSRRVFCATLELPNVGN